MGLGAIPETLQGVDHLLDSTNPGVMASLEDIASIAIDQLDGLQDQAVQKRVLLFQQTRHQPQDGTHILIISIEVEQPLLKGLGDGLGPVRDPGGEVSREDSRSLTRFRMI